MEKLQKDLQDMKRQHDDAEKKIASLRQEVARLDSENSTLQKLSKRNEAGEQFSYRCSIIKLMFNGPFALAMTSTVPQLLAETAFGSDPQLYQFKVRLERRRV